MARKTQKAIEAERKVAQNIRERAALRWSDASDIEPDVPIPENWRELSTGWTFNAYSRRVDVACSSTIGHAIGRTDHTTTQRGIRLYSTRQRALRALRVALEHEFAAELAKIDAELERLD